MEEDIRSFAHKSTYALKDALTPLFTTIFNVAVHVGLIFFLLTICTGENAILSVPLAVSGAATIEAVVLGLLLSKRFRSLIARERRYEGVARSQVPGA